MMDILVETKQKLIFTRQLSRVRRRLFWLIKYLHIIYIILEIVVDSPTPY